MNITFLKYYQSFRMLIKYGFTTEPYQAETVGTQKRYTQCPGSRTKIPETCTWKKGNKRVKLVVVKLNFCWLSIVLVKNKLTMYTYTHIHTHIPFHTLGSPYIYKTTPNTIVLVKFARCSLDGIENNRNWVFAWRINFLIAKTKAQQRT